MRLHLPLSLFAAVMACYVGVASATPTADSTQWTTDSDLTVAGEYAVLADGFSTTIALTNGGTTTISSGLYIDNGVTFAINQGANCSAVAQLTGAITGSGTLVWKAANGIADYASVLILSSKDSTFSGTIIVSQKDTQSGGSILRVSGTGLSNAVIDLSGTLNTSSAGSALEVDGSASISGLNDSADFSGTHKGRVQATSANATTLTFAGNGSYTYGGTIGLATDDYFRRVGKDNKTVPTGEITLQMTGSGTQTLSGSTINANLEVSNGTLELTSADLTFAKSATVSGGTLSFSNATIGEGFTLTSNGGSTTFSNLKAWAGTHTIKANGGSIDFGSITLGSSDTLTIGGNVSLSNLTINDATLSYTVANASITTTNLTTTSGSIDLSGIDFSALTPNDDEYYTVNLGADLSNGFTVLGYSSNQYQFQGTTLLIKEFETGSSTWTWATGAGTTSSQEQTAKILTLDGSDADVALGALHGLTKTEGDLIFTVTNSSTTKVNINGVYNGNVTLSEVTTYVGNVWMNLSEGVFGTVAGGILNKWTSEGDNLYNSSLQGDTYIQLSGTAEADHVVGGNLKGGNSSNNQGDRHVSILDNALVHGSVIGGASSAHSGTTTLTGNTNVLIKSVQYSNSAGVLDDLNNDNGYKFVIGSSSWTNNYYASTKVTGNSSITIDLSDVSIATDDTHNIFAKNIIGGSYGSAYWGGTNNIGGSTSISITGKEGVTFSGYIIGGSKLANNTSSTLNIGGSSTVTISGASTFSGNIYGGSYSQQSAGTLNIGGDVTVSISGRSTFLGNIYAAGNRSTVSGSATVTIASGSSFGSADSSVTIAGTAGATVSGKKTLSLTGDFGSTDFQYATMSQFDAISNDGAVTLYGLTESASLTKQGAGALTLGATADASNAIISQFTSLALEEGSVAFSNGDAGQWTGEISLAHGTSLSGLTGTLLVGSNAVSSLSLALSSSNIGNGTAETSAMIDGANIEIQGSGLTLDLSNDDIITLLLQHKLADATSYLTLTTGTITCSDALLSSINDKDSLLFNSGIKISGVEGGSLLLSGEATGIYNVEADQDVTKPHQVDSYTTLSAYEQVVIDQNQSLVVNVDGAPGALDGEGIEINNLSGASGSSLTINNKGTDTAVAILNSDIGADTEMSGSITGDNVEFIKRGENTLKVTGDMDATKVRVQEGTLALNGSKTSIDSLVLDSTTADLSTTSIGGHVTTTLSDENKGGELELASAGTLELTGKSALTDSSITGDGSLVVGKDAVLDLSNTASVSKSNIQINAGTLAVSDAASLNAGKVDLTNGGLLSLESKDYSVTGLNADSASSIELAGSTLTVKGNASNSINGSIQGKGTLAVDGGSMDLNGSGNKDLFLRLTNASMTLDSTATGKTKALRAAASGSISYEGVELNSASSLVIGSSSATDQRLDIGTGGLTMNSGSSLSFYLGTSTEDDFIAIKPLVTTTGAIALKSGSTVELINSESLVSAENETLNVTLMTGASVAEVGSVSFKASFLETVYGNLTLKADGNNVVLTGVVKEENVFGDSGMTPNAQSGSNLLWKSRFKLKNGDSTLKSAYLGVYDMIKSGNDAGAQRALAAIAGSTINATGTAQRDALRDQLVSVRNRTVTMGVKQGYNYDDMPYYHMWIEGTGTTTELTTDGDEGGYKLNSWGGTVGCDVDLTEHTTLGAALSAQYGSLSSSAAEYASGDLDSYYVSLFGRFQKNAWAHTLILTGSWSDASLNRTVNYGSGSYSTSGDTTGTGFGAMYEATYDIALDEDKTSIIQPLFNASIVKTTMDGYTEGGADNAGLKVGKQDWTTATLALGARWMGLVGTNVFGREALLEIRANIAQDLGDDQGETSVALSGNPGFSQTVYGAKVGKTAGQFGVGLNLPVGQQGTIFVNGNADVRSGAHSFNGSIGYRYSF